MTEIATRTGALSMLAELETLGMITPRALVIDDPDFPFERWVALGEFFGETKTRVSFYLGDWLNFGSSGVYGEGYAQALEATDRSYNTLKNYAYVCRSVSRSRRRDDLSFSHHAEVASLAPADQREWLAQAAPSVPGAKPRLNVQELRSAIRRGEALPPQQVVPPDPLSPLGITSAAGALAAAGAVLSDPEAATVLTRDKARRGLEQAGETLTAASKVGARLDTLTAEIATLRELNRELLALAAPTPDPAIIGVPKENLDRIADVVLDRPINEGGATV